ncbi:hypothetical protein BDQ12DRAFT_676461 [Crucibulum laeve]|uniref:Uncharacterized protein n=1 Tax=Crucibulum laeve TaxID=68775 RepID=A0A5C3MFE6_9AGAR|nr:hypothetical protein BDQ12DRAFT_676461 [Crucibulum laeve]
MHAQNTASSTSVFVLDVGKRFLKFSFVGLVILGTSIATAFEATHMWVEHNSLAPEKDEEIKKWQWDLGAEHWTGDPVKGGTDPGLGIKGRHMLRAAWMAYNWGVGSGAAATGTDSEPGRSGANIIHIIDARIQRAEVFLRNALYFAEASSSKLHSHTLPQILTLHAAMLENLGTALLPDSRIAYERAWAGLSGKGLFAAQVAEKVGEVCSRLGLGNEAVEWWKRAIQLSTEEKYNRTYDEDIHVPQTAPASPLGQRILAKSLVALSAYYAQSGQLSKAQSVEENALDLIRSIPQPSSLASASPPQALHALFLLQRSSLLSIHLAEVIYARRKSQVTCMQYLTAAAESSERVARVLVGLSPHGADEFNLHNPIPVEKSQLSAVYTSSSSMNKAAKGLLRDSLRTAAEAWNLLGILHEEREGPGSKTSLGCFQRAVGWAGVPTTEDPSIRTAAEGILKAEWNVFWGNYTRAKHAAERQTKK